MVHSFSASFWREAEQGNLSVKLPKLNVMINSQQLGHFNRLGIISTGQGERVVEVPVTAYQIGAVLSHGHTLDQAGALTLSVTDECRVR